MSSAISSSGLAYQTLRTLQGSLIASPSAASSNTAPFSASASASGTVAAASSEGAGGSAQAFTPDTMSALLGVQSSGMTPAQSQFSQLDSDGDGAVTQEELDAHFAGADPAVLGAAFSGIDANADGAISGGEFESARWADGVYHLHHLMERAESAFGLGAGPSPLSAIDGATSELTSNSDGSTSTTITYADGSTVTMTTPASDPATSDPSASNVAANNLIERLIRIQAQFLTPSPVSDVTTV